MDREEILARSRAENQGSDECERRALEKAGHTSAMAGMLACCAVAVLEGAIAERVSLTSWLIYFTILAATFWAKYRYRRQKHEMAAAIAYTGLGLLFAALFAMELTGWRRG